MTSPGWPSLAPRTEFDVPDAPGRRGRPARWWLRAGLVGLVTAVAVAAVGLLVRPRAERPIPLPALVHDALREAPGRDGQYAHPPPRQAHSAALAAAALAAGADLGAPPPGYRVARVGRVGGVAGSDALSALAEIPASGRTGGHGLYVVRTGAQARLVVQVPHPVADQRTEDLGVQLFTAAEADVLMLATAHRTAGGGDADVAHAPGTTFSAVNAAVVGPGSVVVQLHGFAEARHPGYGDVVLSGTVARPTALVERLATALEEAGLDTCVYDGRRCAELAGTTNLQAAHARSVGAEFLHVELSDGVREDPARSAKAVAALAEVLAS